MPRLSLPAHVFMVRARGREYFYFQPHRGTKAAAERVALPGLPTAPDGTPNPAWWAAYRCTIYETRPQVCRDYVPWAPESICEDVPAHKTK